MADDLLASLQERANKLGPRFEHAPAEKLARHLGYAVSEWERADIAPARYPLAERERLKKLYETAMRLAAHALLVARRCERELEEHA